MSKAASTAPDEMVPDPQVCREFNITPMTLSRWDSDPNLNFPPILKIRNRNFRSRRALEAFKERLMRRAIAERSKRLERPALRGYRRNTTATEVA